MSSYQPSSRRSGALISRLPTSRQSTSAPPPGIGYVYKIEHLKKRASRADTYATYIGQTIRPASVRWKEHFNSGLTHFVASNSVGKYSSTSTRPLHAAIGIEYGKGLKPAGNFDKYFKFDIIGEASFIALDFFEYNAIKYHRGPVSFKYNEHFTYRDIIDLVNYNEVDGDPRIPGRLYDSRRQNIVEIVFAWKRFIEVDYPIVAEYCNFPHDLKTIIIQTNNGIIPITEGIAQCLIHPKGGRRRPRKKGTETTLETMTHQVSRILNIVDVVKKQTGLNLYEFVSEGNLISATTRAIAIDQLSRNLNRISNDLFIQKSDSSNTKKAKDFESLVDSWIDGLSVQTGRLQYQLKMLDFLSSAFKSQVNPQEFVSITKIVEKNRENFSARAKNRTNRTNRSR